MPTTRIARRLVGPASMTLMVLAGCANTGHHVSSWGDITVGPGDTGNCLSNPCSIFVQMPPGEGTYLVSAEQLPLGRYPAGVRVGLGGFYESTSIRFPETGLPPAYIYIPSSH